MKPRHRAALLLPLTIFFLSGLLPVTLAHAGKKDADEPIHINARAVDVNEKTGVAVYRGNVVVEQGGLTIKADHVEISSKDSKAEFLRATGNPVKLQQQADTAAEAIEAEARQVNYRVSVRQIDMAGEVSLQRGEDRFTGHTLHYDLNTNSLTAAGDEKNDGRVRAVIQPRKPETTPASVPAPQP
jgi:lipopolysaccharide export system protein LptA